MDILGWFGWLVWKILMLGWSLIWFLLGGWVSTLAQIGVVALVIFGYKYGWRQAPQELLSRATAFGRFVWAWARSRELPIASRSGDERGATHTARSNRVREAGDVNVSTLLSLMVFGGLGLLAML